MKTLLILLLAGALVGGAYLSRPSAARADAFVREQQHKQSLLARIFHPKHYTVHDRLLWIDIECDGRVAYVGAFGHFFDKTGEAK